MTAATTERKKARPSGTKLSAGNLKAALAAVQGAVGGDRHPKPILRNVLIANGLITATDLEVQIEHELWAGDSPCTLSLLVPFARLWSILSLCQPSDEVTITPGETSCVVAAGHGTWTIPTESAAEYPEMDAPGVAPITRLPADQFCRAVRGVVYAADSESSRYALGAVCLEVKGDEVSVVATDGRRLSLVKLEHDLAVDDSSTLVPERVMQLLARLAERAGDEASVQLEASANTLVATIGGTTVTARLTEGKFPRWRDVFPTRDVEATAVARDQLLAATRAAAIVTTENSLGVDYTVSESGIWLHGQSAESGESSVTCDVVKFGVGATVKLDPRFVVQFLAGIPADEEPNVEVEAVDATSAVVLRCGEFWGVIMPLAKDA
jgi:DNA polymerase-3 subunit beta